MKTFNRDYKNKKLTIESIENGFLLKPYALFDQMVIYCEDIHDLINE